MDKNFFEEKYWKNEIENEFPDRDKLRNDNFFVVSYIETPPPCDAVIHTIMNFEHFDKMLSYIKHTVLRFALADALDIEFEDALQDNFEDLIGQKWDAHQLTEDQLKAISYWFRIDEIRVLPEEEREEEFADFNSMFNSGFSEFCKCNYGFEVVMPSRDLAEFWEDFFMLDRDDEDDTQELESLKEAVRTGNTEELNNLINNRN